MREYHIDGLKFNSIYDCANEIMELSLNELEEENKDQQEFFREMIVILDNLKVGDVTEFYGTEVWIEDLVPDDYTLELYDVNGNWIEQIMVSTEYQDILDYEKENPIDENKYYYSEWYIQYDNETGEEMCSGPMV